MAATKKTGASKKSGVFMVNLAELHLKDSEQEKINAAIQQAVMEELAKMRPAGSSVLVSGGQGGVTKLQWPPIWGLVMQVES